MLAMIIALYLEWNTHFMMLDPQCKPYVLFGDYGYSKFSIPVVI